MCERPRRSGSHQVSSCTGVRVRHATRASHHRRLILPFSLPLSSHLSVVLAALLRVRLLVCACSSCLASFRCVSQCGEACRALSHTHAHTLQEAKPSTTRGGYRAVVWGKQTRIAAKASCTHARERTPVYMRIHTYGHTRNREGVCTARARKGGCGGRGKEAQGIPSGTRLPRKWESRRKARRCHCLCFLSVSGRGTHKRTLRAPEEHGIQRREEEGGHVPPLMRS